MLGMSPYQIAAKHLHKARKIAILTGAGVSKESGVPTFRDALEGLWANFDPEELATPQAFQRNPKMVWDWYVHRRQMIGQAKPNAGHFALAQLQQRYPHTTLITQNVDDLHEQAGSAEVVHLHGMIARTKCFFNCQGDPTIVDLSQTNYREDDPNTPPPCPHCGRWLRPDVVWFNENLPTRELNQASRAAQTCDVMLVIGTSGMVYPAAALPQTARSQGAVVIEVNPENTPLTAYAQVVLRGPSGEVLPQVLAAL